MNIIGLRANASTQAKKLEFIATSKAEGFFQRILFRTWAVLGWVPPEAEVEMRI